ncbi:MAG: ribonuclease HI family protein [Candidatus Bathyarchaeota archaeon]
MKLKIYSDGACRGNPGPSAIAFMILDEEDRLLKEWSEYVGIGTNNQAEYRALISALKAATNLGTELVGYSDSELVVKQMNGEYKVSDPKLRNLWAQAVSLKETFEKTVFLYVPRTDMHIKRIDHLANQELDKISDTKPHTEGEETRERHGESQVSQEGKENVLLQESNKGGYKLEVLAQFEDPDPVAYILRVSTPEGTKVDYRSTVEGFRNVGDLLLALHYFAQTKLYPKDVAKLREVLTSENMKSFAEVLKSARFAV